MNRERILQLADVIEKTPHREPDYEEWDAPITGFNMGEWSCGTVGCIAGWVGIVFDLSYLDASEVLGLDPKVGRSLFKPVDRASWNEITPAHAAAVLRHLAETGKVDWTIDPAARLLHGGK